MMYINQNLGNATGYTDEGLQRELENYNRQIKVYQDQFNAAKRAGDADAMEENQAEIDFLAPLRDEIVAEINRRAALPPPPPPTPIVIVKSARQIELEAQLAQTENELQRLDNLIKKAEDIQDYSMSDFYAEQYGIALDKVRELQNAIQSGQDVFVESLPVFPDYEGSQQEKMAMDARYAFFSVELVENKTPEQKAAYFNFLRSQGFTEAGIFEAIEYWMGPQRPEDLQALKTLAEQLRTGDGPIVTDSRDFPTMQPPAIPRGPDTGPGSPLPINIPPQQATGGNTGLLIAAALAALTLLG